MNEIMNAYHRSCELLAPCGDEALQNNAIIYAKKLTLQTKEPHYIYLTSDGWYEILDQPNCELTFIGRIDIDKSGAAVFSERRGMGEVQIETWRSFLSTHAVTFADPMNDKTESRDNADDIYARFVQEAEDEGIDSEDITNALNLIKRLRNPKGKKND